VWNRDRAIFIHTISAAELWYQSEMVTDVTLVYGLQHQWNELRHR
jgi:hypothetical protein